MQNGAACPNDEKVKQIFKDMYFGNGKPGLTTRMETMERTTAKIADSLKWIVRLLVGTLLSVIGATIVAVITRR